jgi:uncharacterized protein (DUF4415 family)
MSSFLRLPSVWDGPMVFRPELPALPVSEAVSVRVGADVASWFAERGLDVASEADAILRAHIEAHDGGRQTGR